MTTPPNHNTADQSGAMQPTSSASSADKLAELIRQIDGNHSMGAAALAEALLPHLSAIVPQVVQAPIGIVRQLDNAFIEGKRACGFLFDESIADGTKLYTAPIVATPKLTECRHCGFMVALNQAPADLPIVATVPSEQKLYGYFVQIGDCSAMQVEDDHKDDNNVFPLYRNADPSPTEQASDVRNAAPSGWQFSVEHDDDNRSWLTIKTPMGTRASFSCASKIDSGGMTIAAQVLDYLKDELVKSAPAAKGNAQDEVKS